MSYSRFSTLSIYRKLSQIGIAFVLTAVFLTLYVSTLHKGSTLLEYKNNAMADSLVNTSSRSITTTLEHDADNLQLLVDNLAADTNVHSVIVYDVKGLVLAQSTDALPVNQQKQQLLVQQWVNHTKDLIVNDQLVGYLKMTLESGNIRAQSHHLQRELLGHQHLLLAILFVIAVLLTKGLSRLGEAVRAK